MIPRPIPRTLAIPITTALEEAGPAGASGVTLPTPRVHWRADTYTGTSPTMTLTDLSGNGHDCLQIAGTATPGTGGLNSTEKITMSSARFESSQTAYDARPATIFAVWTRTGSGATTGFYGAAGASSINSLWFGFESVNRLNTYSGDGGSQGTGALNTLADGFTNPSIFIGHVGYEGISHGFNGEFQGVVGNSKGQTPSIQAALGTDYRTANGDFYEIRVYDRRLTQDEEDAVLDELSTRYGMTVDKWSDLTAVPTLVQVGDSVSNGRALNTGLDAEYTGDITGCSVWNGTAFATLNASATNNNQLGESASAKHGPEVALCKEYLDTHGGSCYLLKWGTSSRTAADQNNSNTLYPDSQFVGATHALAELEFLQATAAAVAAGNRFDTKLILFCLGSNDAFLSEPAVDAFQANMDRIKAAWKGICMAHSTNYALLEMSDAATDTWDLQAEGVAWAAANSDVTLIEGDFGTDDSLHPNVAGNVTVGTTAAGIAGAP